jgi:hypothetical protein
MPHYHVDRAAYDQRTRTRLRVDLMVGGVVAPNMKTAKRIATERYWQKTGDGLGVVEVLELYAARSHSQRMQVEEREREDLEKEAAFAEEMQIILGARPVKRLTRKDAEP